MLNNKIFIFMIKTMINLIFIVCVFFLFILVAFRHLPEHSLFMHEKSDVFFTKESIKPKHILLKRYRLEYYIFSQENKNCEIIEITKLINEVKCEK